MPKRPNQTGPEDAGQLAMVVVVYGYEDKNRQQKGSAYMPTGKYHRTLKEEGDTVTRKNEVR